MMPKTRASRSPAKAALPPRRRARQTGLAPSLGPWVCAWIERYLVHAEGDHFGKPFRLRAWQKAFIYRAYELKSDGARRYRRGLLGLPKGNGKTELAAALAIAELAGPVCFHGWAGEGRPAPPKARLSPDIPVAAASFEQADLLFGAAKTMVRQGALRDLCEVYDTEILLKGRPGRMYRVAAAAGTNDGRRPTFFVADELHEWTGNKERVHLVLSNGRAKRAGAWELAISTAGWDSLSLLGRLYRHGKLVEAGDEQDPEFLFVWHEAPPELDLADPTQLEQAIRIANPAAGDFLAVEDVKVKYAEIPEYEFRRYHLDQWVSAPERWLPPGAWEAAAKPRDVALDEPIVVGFDGSWAGDSTAVLGCTLEGYLFVIDAWEKPDGAAADWRVPVMDVEQSVRNTCATRRVLAVACDPYRWQRSIALLGEEGLPMLEWPSHQPGRMAPATGQFEEGLRDGQLTHDGDPRMARHIANCVTRIDSRGRRITKDQKDSARHIDLAVAGVIAYDMSIRNRGQTGQSKYETEDPLVIEL